MPSLFAGFWADERGATAIEYGLILAIVFLGIVGSVGSVGSSVRGLYEKVVDAWVGL